MMNFFPCWNYICKGSFTINQMPGGTARVNGGCALRGCLRWRTVHLEGNREATLKIPGPGIKSGSR